MCYSLIDIFNQAKEDEFSAVLDGDDFEARILSGIRIEQERAELNGEDIKAVNTNMGFAERRSKK